MNAPGRDTPDPLEDALIAARLCAIDPGLGGMILRGSTLRDAVIAELRAALPPEAPLRRVPAHIDDERLLGGIDLAAALARGAAISRAGLLAEADGGVVVVPMAERLPDATAARIAAVIDTGVVAVERDAVALRTETRFVTLALDDGIEPDERPPMALAERMAFWIDLTSLPARGGGLLAEAEWRMGPAAGVPPVAPAVRHAPPFGPAGDVAPDKHGRPPHAEEDSLAALVGTAAALGIDSIRAPLLAARAARASARLAGRIMIADDDLALAARLVLAPRATRIPDTADAPTPEPPPPPSNDDGKDEGEGDIHPLDDIVLAAALAALPKDVLALIATGSIGRRRTIRTAGAGERRRSGTRGRPLAACGGVPGGGRRLSLIDTLRTAAPWQRLRGREDRILIRRDDLRIRRFETRAEAVTIFVVDASGSSALARLAEAKGAVELLLAEAYVKRAQVALIAFRGTSAELLLPPTRSLTRARRLLAELPGGGGTPLAAGLNAARDLAETVRSRGRTPFVVVLTDGRANIAVDGSAVRTTAAADATAAAKAIGGADLKSAFLDISARPGPEGAALAAAMRARYLPLPRADAATMHAAVRAAQAR